MSYSPQFLEELRERLSLADIVSRHVRLIKRGHDYVGLCPFHKEKSPSFTVVEDKKFYHCFGCGAHGDIIGFTMRVDNLPFRDAVEDLAKQANLAIPQESPRERERAARAITLYDVNEAACEWFEQHLLAQEGRDALTYLRQRGIENHSIKRFRLGFASGAGNALLNALAKKYEKDLLVDAGLVRLSPDGLRLYDFFRNRLVFPICDRTGRVIAFGGRTLGDDKPKYINSPETPLFDKSRALYGFYQARTAIAPDLPPIVCEGYMDVIALDQAGFKTAVAPLGTALTETQLTELWKVSEGPILCFDGDAAGQRAANRVLDRALPLLMPEKSLKFAVLDGGDDPDSLIRRDGRAAMETVLNAAVPLSEFLWWSETKGKELNTPEKLAKVQSSLERRINLISNRTLQQSFRTILIYNKLVSAFRTSKPRGKAFKKDAENISTAAELLKYLEDHATKSRIKYLILATAINHPWLLKRDIDDFVYLKPEKGDVFSIYTEVMHYAAEDHQSISMELYDRLRSLGHDKVLRSIFGSPIYRATLTSHPHAGEQEVSLGWEALLNRLYTYELKADLMDRIRAFEADFNEDEWGRLRALIDLYGRHMTEEDLMERSRTRVELGRDWEPPARAAGSETTHSAA